MRMPRPLNSEWWRPDGAVPHGDRGGASTAVELQVSDSAIPYWAMMAFTFILLLAPQSFFPALAPLRIAFLTAVVAVTTYLFDKVARGQPIFMGTREIRIIVCLVAWVVLTVPFSLRPGESLSYFLEVYFKALAIFWLLSHTVNRLTRLRQVAWALTLMTIPITTTAIGNFLSGTYLPGTDRILGYPAPMTGNPNGLAKVLNLILPLSLALLLVTRRAIVRAGLLGIILLEVIGVVLTFSRGGFVTLATTVVMYLWKLRKRNEAGWAVTGLLIALLCLPLVPSNYLARLSTITNKEADPTGSAQMRWSDMVDSAKLVVHNPVLGVGLRMNGLALAEERGPVWDPTLRFLLDVHNVYLVYATELGLPGLVLFLMFFVGCMKSARLVQRGSGVVPALRDLFYLAEGIQISLIAFAVSSLFDEDAYDFSCYYFAGLAIAAKATFEAESGNTLDHQSSPQKLQELVYATKQG